MPTDTFLPIGNQPTLGMPVSKKFHSCPTNTSTSDAGTALTVLTRPLELVNLFFLIAIISVLSGCASINQVVDAFQGKSKGQNETPVNANDFNEDFSLNLNDKSDLAKAMKNELNRSQTLTRGGIKYLLDGEYDKASDVFNTALSFDINNALLHFFNGYTYHQLYLRGDNSNLPLAEIGYKTAAAKEHSLSGPAYAQLGELYLDSKKYALAEEYLLLALQKKRTPALLYNYARATGLNGSWAKSRSAISELDLQGWSNPQLIKAKAIFAAAMSNSEETKSLVEIYSKSTTSKADINYVNFRVNQIDGNISDGRFLALNEEAVIETPDKTQNLQTPIDAPPSGPNTGPPVNPEPAAPVNPEPAAPNDSLPSAENKSNDTQNPDLPKTIGKWYRCDTDTQISTTMGNDVNSTDEYILAPTLPQSCPGENPMSAVIEITMIQSYDAGSSTSGVNILDGLNAILTRGGSRSVDYSSGTTTTTTSRDSTWLLANGASALAVTYSLNIANSGLNQAKLLSRPAMTVIDRVPSVFFAGSNISLGIGGADAYTTPTVVDKTIGVSLSVTPTFVDDDNVLISVRTSNAGISNSLITVPSALLQQSRNSMRSSAIMKFDQTIVINGLRQETSGLIDSGVPILKELPLLQYLFKSTVASTTSLNYITFLTLRRPSPPEEAANSQHQNLIPALKNYISFTEKDFEPAPETARDKFDRIINDLKRLVYF